MSTTVMRYAAEAFGDRKEHLIFEGVGGERPPMTDASARRQCASARRARTKRDKRARGSAEEANGDDGLRYPVRQ
jgi:hypothetical protein